VESNRGHRCAGFRTVKRFAEAGSDSARTRRHAADCLARDAHVCWWSYCGELVSGFWFFFVWASAFFFLVPMAKSVHWLAFRKSAAYAV